jgi:Ni,Fe-hydrogenase maturation factor
VAWHILSALARRLGCPFAGLQGNTDPSPEMEEELPSGREVDFLFDLQLLPEMAELIGQYQRVCFVDAHTGQAAEDVHFSAVEPGFQTSPFTHHMTPATLLLLVETLGKQAAAGNQPRVPEAILVSVRGYHFEFSQELSTETLPLVDRAVEYILDWLG